MTQEPETIETLKTEAPPPKQETLAEAPSVTLEQQLDEMKEKYLRSLADSENIRKRMAKEKQDIVGFGIESTICDFLPVIDNFENALNFAEAASSEVKNWALGFQMILAQFKQVLQNNGISAFASEGMMFDPAYHDAVESIETADVPEGTILKEFTKGYKSSSRTIRPARVKVARSPSQKKSEPCPAPDSSQQAEIK